jgi:hypothetical protein
MALSPAGGTVVNASELVKVIKDALTAISQPKKSSVFDCLAALCLALVRRLTGCLLLLDKGLDL